MLTHGAQVAWLRDNLTPRRNHRTPDSTCCSSSPCAARPGQERRTADFALAELERNLGSDFRPDGVHVESSTHYHLIVLRSLVGVRENARRFALELRPGFDERLSRALDFAKSCTCGGSTPVSGDRLHVVFGAGQVGCALGARLAELGLAVRVVSRHRPAALVGGVDWRLLLPAQRVEKAPPVRGRVLRSRLQPLREHGTAVCLGRVRPGRPPIVARVEHGHETHPIAASQSRMVRVARANPVLVTATTRPNTGGSQV
jgi:hypothetical protein